MEPTVQTDEERLLEQLAGGDRRAAEVLVERTYRQIYSALHRLCDGDADLAADLCQEAYRKAWAALPRFRGGSAFSTWLYRIAYTTLLNHVRRPRRLVRHDAIEDEGHAMLRDPAPGPEGLLGSSLEAGRMRRAVLALPEDLRFTVTARFWGDLPVSEIARQVGVSAVAIRKRLRKAYSLLALELEGETS